jgi:CRP/FNR family transcriptional regulator, cyclic AMP receptor protein
MHLTAPGTVSLLDADPDLGLLISAAEIEDARQRLTVRRHVVEPGNWEGERLRDAGPEHVGLLVVEGLMTRELALADNVSSELLGPGDLVRPWQAAGPERLVPSETRWTALERTVLAVLDRRFALELAQCPEVNVMLIDRLTERSHRLSLMQSISQLNGVDRRLLTLFWHLAERWGRVTRVGVAITISVPHRVLAELVGARRPTVSSALGRLAEAGELVREPDGTWLLTGAPVGMPTEDAARIVRLRRHRAEKPARPPEHQRGLPVTGRIAELHEELTALRAENERRRDQFAALADETRELMSRLESQRAARNAARP